MLVKILGTLAVTTLVVLGALWLVENIRLSKKSNQTKES